MELVKLGDVVIQPNQRKILTDTIKERKLCKLVIRRETIQTSKKETNLATRSAYISVSDLQKVYERLKYESKKELLKGAVESIGIFLGEIDIKECNYE